jgi:ribonuclease Y
MNYPQALILAAVIAFVALISALVGGSVVKGRERRRREEERSQARDDASRILEQARGEAETARKDAELRGREEVLRLRGAWDEEERRRRAEWEGEEDRQRGEWEREEARRRDEVEKMERRLSERAESLEKKFDLLKERDTAQETRSKELQRKEEELLVRDRQTEGLLKDMRLRLESLSGLTEREARAQLIEEIRDSARAEAAQSLREIREEAQRTAGREAKQIVTMAIQKIAADVTAQATVSVVQLPSDDMKGRIIGREGRNIRSFEQATGIDVVIDDTPEAIVLSGFDPIRREVARIAMEKLIEDGRIHPGRIEEVVEKSRSEVDEGMREAAEQALYDLGIHQMHPEILKVLGRLKFRTSYGQNQLTHSKEVARLAGAMAAEMGLDVQLAKRAGLLHDVGKGMTHDHEGTHVELGYELCRKYNEHPVVLNSIRAHHDEEPHGSPEAFLVTASDAISGSRPGARREMFETYVKRLEKLEKIALDFPGVERCFAVQAGREVRVMVEPDKVSDEEMTKISEKVARRFEEELQYPGQIKVVLIRETRAVDFAR